MGRLIMSFLKCVKESLIHKSILLHEQLFDYLSRYSTYLGT